jgi:hypothetical protein
MGWSNRFEDIKPRSKVVLLVHAGGNDWREATGTVVMRGPHGWAVNLGGRHGRPGVVTPDNFVKVKVATLKDQITRLAHDNPDGIRQHLVPLLRKHARRFGPELKLRTKAESNGGYEYDVVLKWGPLSDDEGPILDIKKTPGSWYLNTIRKWEHARGPVPIDVGQDWLWTNPKEVLKEAFKQAWKVERL